MGANSEISKYFSGAISGFVANRFKITISAMRFQNLRFYAKKVSLPYETLLFTEDIYVSDVTLAKPRNVLAVQTYSELGVVFRMDPENTIIKQLEGLFAATHNLSKFETTANKQLFTISLTVYGADYQIKKQYTYNNCTLFEMNSYDVDASDRKFKEYDVKFTCNRVAPNDYAQTHSNGQLALKTSCAKLSNDLKAAYDRFNSECNKRKSGSPVNGVYLTEDDIISSITTSGIFNAYANARQSLDKCKNIKTPLSIGNDFPSSAIPKILQMANTAGIPSNEIEIRG